MCNDKYPKEDSFFSSLSVIEMIEGDAKKLLSGSTLFLSNAGLVWCKRKGRKIHHKDLSNTVSYFLQN